MTLTSIIPAHTLASWLLGHIDALLDFLGLHRHQTLEQIIYFVVIVAASYFIGWVIRKIILVTTRKMVRLRNTPAGRDLLQEHTFTKCSHFIPPLVFLSLAPFAFDSSSEILTYIIRFSLVYLLVALGIGINAVLTFIFLRYNDKENTKNLPIKGTLNIGKGIVWLLVVIFSVSIIVHKSPAALLGGMTAFAAVLMLVFKDSILGFVAGIQMSQNDMLHVGDWITVPSTPADGTVEDVSLTTVKVRNFDNTIIMVPPYTLVSTSFQNWRGMQETGVRRVAKEIFLNPDTVASVTPELLASVSAKYPAMKTFIDSMQAKQQTVAWEPGTKPLNGTIETNLGLFRAYLISYLLGSDMVDKERDLMVKVQPMSAEGVPLQLYFFAVTIQWEQYEAVQSTVMEHAIAAAADFGLEILSADHLMITQK